MEIKLSVDFNNADEKGRVRLTTNGTKSDIERLNIQLFSGLKVLLDDEEGLRITGTVEFSNVENIWVAVIDWNNFIRYDPVS